MSETLTMSSKERQRLQVLGHLKHDKTTIGKAFASPACESLVPPHRPFPPRQAVYRLKSHRRSESLHMIQGLIPLRISLQAYGYHASTKRTMAS